MGPLVAGGLAGEQPQVEHRPARRRDCGNGSVTVAHRLNIAANLSHLKAATMELHELLAWEVIAQVQFCAELLEYM